MCFLIVTIIYARTYQILDGKVIETDGVSEMLVKHIIQKRTLYIAAGSASVAILHIEYS